LKSLTYTNYSEGTGQLGSSGTNMAFQASSFVQDTSLTTAGVVDKESAVVRLAQDMSYGGSAVGRAIWVIKGSSYWEAGCQIVANGVVLAFTGSHSGLYSKLEAIETGDILLDTPTIIHGDINNNISIVTKSTAPMQKTVIGVYNKDEDPGNIPFPLKELVTKTANITHTNGIVTQLDQVTRDKVKSEYEELVSTHNICTLNALGEGLINVCGENGDIEIGDYITTSSIPGKGMKQDDDLMRNYTVAKSRENVTFSSPTEVKMIACTYHCG
jgi:hypothetical protein